MSLSTSGLLIRIGLGSIALIILLVVISGVFRRMNKNKNISSVLDNLIHQGEFSTVTWPQTFIHKVLGWQYVVGINNALRKSGSQADFYVADVIMRIPGDPTNFIVTALVVRNTIGIKGNLLMVHGPRRDTTFMDPFRTGTLQENPVPPLQDMIIQAYSVPQENLDRLFSGDFMERLEHARQTSIFPHVIHVGPGVFSAIYYRIVEEKDLWQAISFCDTFSRNLPG